MLRENVKYLHVIAANPAIRAYATEPTILIRWNCPHNLRNGDRGLLGDIDRLTQLQLRQADRGARRYACSRTALPHSNADCRNDAGVRRAFSPGGKLDSRYGCPCFVIWFFCDTHDAVAERGEKPQRSAHTQEGAERQLRHAVPDVHSRSGCRCPPGFVWPLGHHQPQAAHFMQLPEAFGGTLRS